MGASLPPKEANLFKLIVKSYETKQYKKGLKAADAILKKFPDHGETLSMKGLTLNCMDRKSEAYELVRQGLKNDLKSHVCWHVFGLLYRSDREYREAIKCYRNALRIDPDNIEILRDLSLLQAQMRDLSGFVETRQQLLTLKPNHRMNWIGFSVAHHLNSNASKAVEILEAYEGTLENDFPPDNERCEHGEMLLYKISLLEECGFLERALEELRQKESNIVDKLAVKEQEVSLVVKLGHLVEAESLYRALLSMNPDNYRYYEGLQKCVGLYLEDGKYSPDQIDRLVSLYETLGRQYKWSSAVKRIPLDFLQGDKFREAADNYIRPLLTKGVPSLFSDLSSLYNHPGKADILEQLILELEHSIRTSGQYPGSMEKEAPSTLLWTLFFLAQHYDRRGQYETSLSKIDEAIEHTPTVIDLYSVKSRILKHAGDLKAAAAFADEARRMDLADRYVNSDCVKRMLQADQVALAEKIAVLFTKDGEQHNNLHDMQCMWYELASGESYFRQGDLGRALKKFLAVEKHYADITEDQFDFHSYCLRKMTLRSYVEMLKFQDQLHSHAYFHKAAAGAIRCYIKLHDFPPKSTAEEDEHMSNLLPSQKKKLRQKQRKAEARAKKEAEEKNEESNASGVSKSGKRHVKPVDPDPHGEKLLQVEDPLSEAVKYLKLLQKNSPDSLETHLLSFELYTRKRKILLAFQAVKQLLRLDADHPDSHRCLIKFFHQLGSTSAPETESEKLIWSVLEAERPTISQLHEKSLFDANNAFLDNHKDSLMHRAAFTEILYILDSNRKSEAVKLIEESTNNSLPRNGTIEPIREWKLKDCIAVHKLLGTVLVDQDAALRWKVSCAEYFPYSTYFEGRHSSASPNSAFNQLRKNSENDIANHSVGSQNVDSTISNGKSFKDLTI
ncbi:N-terminal acetyltransferase A complex auxiliary subunit NAA15-like [Cicer arietinum]|uniref:N-terminal acetyltransferase A complex auxiliary subunit NAA15-like n=1 Tax=Cicer arietinum TaxID=3827 RepID=A0A1S2YMC2_CICAR|nr:N-terminal acetyltransferase A complex auxiliary subunit NAA15-like [Cicer arietinum]